MIDRNYVLNLIKSKDVTIEEFNWDKLIAPPIRAFFNDYDLQRLQEIATSLRYSAKPQVKYQEIDKIMKSRGFVKLSAGTNRIVYRCIENDTFVAKVAYGSVAMQDNINEYKNQNILKPFCAKTFEVAGNGVLAFSERVNPITSREEFLSVAEDIFELITEFIIGEYVMDDIGTKYFMNYGIRAAYKFGPVVLDYAGLYKLNGNKLYCCKPDNNSTTGVCGGLLDYDAGYNNIVCTKCGRIYKAKDLELKIKENQIVSKSFKGEFNKMKVRISGGTKNVDVTTVVNAIVVDEHKEEEEKVVYTDKKKTIHVKLGNSNDNVERIVNTPKQVVEEVKVEEPVEDPIKEEVIEDTIVEDNVEEVTPAEEIPVVEVPKTTPFTVGGEKKDNKDILRDAFYSAAKLISDNQIKGIADEVYISDAIKHIAYVVDTLRHTTAWSATNELDLLNVVIGDKRYSIDTNSELKGNELTVYSDITYKDENDNTHILNRSEYVYTYDTNETKEIDEVENEEKPAEEIETAEVGHEDHNVDVSEEDFNSYDVFEIEEDSYDPVELTGYEPFSAQLIDISTKIPSIESKKVFVIDDGNGGFLTVGNGDRLLVIDRVNELDSNEASIVSSAFLENVLSAIKENAVEIDEHTFDNVDQSTVNGVPTGDK